jgi:hypothetical protein
MMAGGLNSSLDDDDEEGDAWRPKALMLVVKRMGDVEMVDGEGRELG